MRRYALPTLTAIGLLAAVLPFASASDEVPGGPQKKPIALVNGTVHPVTGPAIERGIVVFDQGKIVSVAGEKSALPEGAVVIDVQGKHVYPGLFEAHSQVGLTEIGAVRATRDFAEAGSINPNVQARVAVNPDSEIIPVTRANGVLLALSAPSGGLVSGQSAVLQLDGWTFEDLTVSPRAGMHVNWPRQEAVFTLPGTDSLDSRRGRGGPSSGVEDLRELFEDARAYHQARQSLGDQLPVDLRLEAMGPVLENRLPLIVSADGVSEIQSAVGFAVEQKVKLILFGGYDAPMCAELLKAHNVPVIISAVHRMPRRRHDAYDEAYTLPQRLHDAGVAYCISGSGRSESWNVRNLAYHAATAVAYGLPADEGLKAITLYPAQILGVADRVGSLETGKDATLIVTSGDPLETETQVELAFIQGRKVALTSRHTRLYEKYKAKYRQLDK